MRCNRKIVKFFSHLNIHSKLKQHIFYEITKTKASRKVICKFSHYQTSLMAFFKSFAGARATV